MKILNFLNKSKDNSDKASNDEFISTIKLIQAGDKLLREEFLSSYTPFMLKVASSTMGKFIDVKNSDEYSIALSAFNEAIDRYDTTRNSSFLLFSETVIKRRLIDYMRKTRRSQELPFSYFEDEGEIRGTFVNPSYDRGFEDVESKEEIIEYKESLREFGITFEDLILNVPKHRDSRELCLKIATTLANDDELFRLLCKHKNIPRNDLQKKTEVHGRTIGRHRKYIIAVCLILKSNLEISKSYLSFTKKGGQL